MDCSASSNEVRFSELFSLFDSAQEYFRDRDRDQRFNELLFEASQLPSKIRRIKISKAREKQRSSEKLKAIEHRLAEVTSRLKLMETECNAKRQLVLEYGENIKNHHHQYKELKQQCEEESLRCANLELERSKLLQNIASCSVECIDAKMSAEVLPSAQGPVSSNAQTSE